MKEVFNTHERNKIKDIDIEKNKQNRFSESFGKVMRVAALFILQSCNEKPINAQKNQLSDEKHINVQKPLSNEKPFVFDPYNAGEQVSTLTAERILTEQENYQGVSFQMIQTNKTWTLNSGEKPLLNEKNEETKSRLDYDLKSLADLEDAANKRELNFVTEGKTEEELNKMYAETILDIHAVRESRIKLAELAYTENDPRLWPYAEACLKILYGEDTQKFLKFKNNSLKIELNRVNREVSSRGGAFTDEDGTIYMGSEDLCLLLNPDTFINGKIFPEELNKYIDALQTLTNELCHFYRHIEFESNEKYEEKLTETNCHNNAPYFYEAIEPPKQMQEIYDTWLSEVYFTYGTKEVLEEKPKLKAQWHIEKESFWLSYLATEYICKNGVTITFDGDMFPDIAKLLGYKKTETADVKQYIPKSKFKKK